MAEPAINYETQEVETKALTVVDQARAVRVTDAESYKMAGSLYKAIGDMIKEVKDTFDPICEAANKAHKAATAKRAQYLDPLQEAYRSVKGLMSAWDQEQERIRQAEQRRLEEIARKEAEERALREAIAAEEEAKRNGATKEEAEEEAAAIIEQPVYVPPVEIPKAVPKVQGVSFRTIKKFRIKNESLIPRQYMTPDMVKIGGVVRALGLSANIPGIEVYEERV